MSTKYPGGVIKSSPVVPSGAYQNSSASGVWTMEQAGYWIKQGNWPTAGAVSSLWSWGANTQGELGLGNKTNYSSPKQVGTLTDWLNITAAGYFSSATKSNGTLWSWGNNGFGNLGLGNTTNYSSPKQVGALTTWLSVSAGGYWCTSAIKTDGTLWSWGRNNVGQLGLGNTTYYSSPKQVGTLTTWSKISVGNSASLAIKTNGTLWAWGGNTQGSLGLGDTTARSSPVQVGLLTNWSLVSATGHSSFAIKTDGTLWSWGNNQSTGMLGLGNTTSYSSPKQVGALTNWLNVSGGGNCAIAIKTDGTLWSWGGGVFGKLGLGNTTYYSSPKQVGALTTWSKSATDRYNSGYAIKTDGTLWAWGFNNNGQLGLGNLTNYSSPKQVGALTTWVSVSAFFKGVLATRT